MKSIKHITFLLVVIKEKYSILKTWNYLKFTKSFLFLALIFFIQASNSFSQGEGNNWYFGDEAAVNFGTDPPSNVLGSQMNVLGGNASISNQNGDLLFYTDGRDVWNRNNVQMPNGFDLMPHVGVAALSVPHPGNANQYYIFSLDSPSWPVCYGFNYSIIDMSADGGLGDVIEKGNRLLGTEETSIKVTAVKHRSENAYWVITHGVDGADASTFYVFKISESGLDPNPQSFDIGSNHVLANNRYKGYLKLSPDGTLLASAIMKHPNRCIELFDFNDLTGEISNYRTFGTNLISPYGLEFSLDGTKMYVTSVRSLYQFDFTNGDAQTLLSHDDSDFTSYQGLQIAPNGIIYMATGTSNTDRYIPGITNPYAAGTSCNFQKDLIDLYPNGVSVGFPIFVQSFFYEGGFSYENICLGQTTQFTLTNTNNVQSVIWDFGDGGTSTLFNPSHTYTSAGSYLVQLTVTTNDNTDYNIEESVEIGNLPIFSITAGALSCEGEDMQLSTPLGFAEYRWSTSSTSNTITVNSSGNYTCTITNSESCEKTESYDLIMNELPIVTLPDQADVYLNQTAVILIGGDPVGGTYTGDFVSGGTFNATAAGPGFHDIQYTYSNPNGCSNTVTAQILVIDENNSSNGEANNWYFGDYAGINFNGPTPVALTNGAMSTHEGCAVISDADGNLLF